jgi:hypothetical protein
MNRLTAPCQSDADHHRNRFEPSVRAALALLDRVAEGIDIPAHDVHLALQVTGDAGSNDFRALRGYARFAQKRESARVDA